MFTLTRAAAAELDRRASAEFGVPSIVLMENAGRGVADVLQSVGLNGSVVVACGKGNNGGDGLVVARHLDLRRAAVQVLLFADPAEFKGDALANYRIVAASKIPLVSFTSFDAAQVNETLRGAGCVVDALLGTGASGAPRGILADAIRAINAAGVPVVAVDIPSGLDCDSGNAAEPTIRAQHTCTFVAAKPGLLVPAAQPYVGRLHILDIGAPRVLVDAMVRGGTP
ncbi:MAG: NAD(P)H-hydrate epimerase [Planctomycetia bacterium]|nr:NAD(P)H-hydrate epimerase [Planctomycetia bacterium]